MSSAKKQTVTVQFIVNVEIAMEDYQPMQEFLQTDLEAAKPYIADKLEKSLNGAFKYNAIVVRASAFEKVK
jgi:hypothetical protein